MDHYEKAVAWIMGKYDVTKDDRYAKYQPLQGTQTLAGILVWFVDRKSGETCHAELDAATARSWAETLLFLADGRDEWVAENYGSETNLIGPVKEGAERDHKTET